jgi:hypothetical protein
VERNHDHVEKSNTGRGFEKGLGFRCQAQLLIPLQPGAQGFVGKVMLTGVLTQADSRLTPLESVNRSGNSLSSVVWFGA